MQNRIIHIHTFGRAQSAMPLGLVSLVRLFETSDPQSMEVMQQQGVEGQRTTGTSNIMHVLSWLKRFDWINKYELTNQLASYFNKKEIIERFFYYSPRYLLVNL
jgi:hypothetical protein